MGVGAAIAAGSQAENGNCALFVHEAIINNVKIKPEFILTKKKLHEEVIKIIAIEIIIKASPTRFDKIVIVPDAPDLGFWYKITNM